MKTRNTFIIAAVVCLLVGSLAFAFFFTPLQVETSLEVAPFDWNIVLDSEEGAVTAHPAGNERGRVVFTLDDLTIEDLQGPDFVFDFDVINEGTVDAIIEDFEITVAGSGTLVGDIRVQLVGTGGGLLVNRAGVSQVEDFELDADATRSMQLILETLTGENELPAVIDTTNNTLTVTVDFAAVQNVG